MATTFGIIGSGWRTDFYMRIMEALPEKFRVSGVVVRGVEKGRAFEQRWGVPTFRTLEEMLSQTAPSFVVLSVPWAMTPDLIKEMADRGIPVLSETPPAPDVDHLNKLYHEISKDARVQVAEQFAFQPQHAARIAVVKSGVLGTVTQAQVSAAHGYHGMSIMRSLLDLGFADAKIRGYNFASQIVSGPNREGDPIEEKMAMSNQVYAILEFDNKLGIFDFTGDQYFSWIRSSRLLVRGDRGELMNDQLKYLKDYQTPVEMNLKRLNAGENGNLEGYYHKGILAGDQWVYRNPFMPGRLTDEEIAIATCLQKMGEYVEGGPSFYSLAEAAQDHYLGIKIKEAVDSGETVQTTKQSWAQ
ncbi:Gfo/Idh/MocA family protein [Paenibacillus radicis (ex Xue et al. 2023)]|uniref:Gfo/Idh/MocA family oxidoreductase n=1 Tax=Paenibacillus radicis (ex Xue et al. 2023) TaxID=2972489 RepID=A0ABT1YGG9_9BACL|nr:Gfo/Idh/MocA family oxidoreductase [Paenibacillus radicis (ex Xue et al. 2023)]MCR8631303.1 Gfo/Idh/MocA family oxidoreductase [Paenibacillus radicis (ex Xue et al. 2023)]